MSCRQLPVGAARQEGFRAAQSSSSAFHSKVMLQSTSCLAAAWWCPSAASHTGMRSMCPEQCIALMQEALTSPFVTSMLLALKPVTDSVNSKMRVSEVVARRDLRAPVAAVMPAQAVLRRWRLCSTKPLFGHSAECRSRLVFRMNS